MKDIALIDADKYCSKCLTIKSIFDFSFDKSSKDGRAYWCKKCASTNSRLNHRRRVAAGDIEYIRGKRNGYIRNRHSISLEEYEVKLKAQDSKCKICLFDLPSDGPLTHLDYNHTTGKLRDFLCTNCNRGLGHFQDNKELLMKAAAYLDSHTEDGNQKEGRCL